IGGGVHGVHLAARLIGEGGVPRAALRILDPGRQLLSRWHSFTRITGMRHMRSSSVHHLDLEPFSLRRFAEEGPYPPPYYAPPFDRPALALFNAHSELVLRRFGLADLHIRDRAIRCEVESTGVRVRLAGGGTLRTDRLVLAIGASEQPHLPSWALVDDPRVQHIFTTEPARWPSSPETVVVVGGGISAGQVALRLLREGHRVHLVSRHAFREHQFDSDTGWLGPEHMTGFRLERDADRRRAIITKARHVGSVPRDVRLALDRVIAADRVVWHRGEVRRLDVRPSRLALLIENTTIEADRVLLATGFKSHRPGGAMIDELVASASLRCAQCGYPIVDSALRGHPRIHVTGPFAELELGPVSRNIAGARRAGDRLIDSIRPPQRPRETSRHTAVSLA
ncbi:MAG: FAD/NAD(P)-binding protein, partial [Myxococcota bacterium]